MNDKLNILRLSLSVNMLPVSIMILEAQVVRGLLGAQLTMVLHGPL